MSPFSSLIGLLFFHFWSSQMFVSFISIFKELLLVAFLFCGLFSLLIACFYPTSSFLLIFTLVCSSPLGPLKHGDGLFISELYFLLVAALIAINFPFSTAFAVSH